MELDVDLVVLAGYLRLLPIVSDFQGRVLNVHPTLLPKFGGKGMHGERAHAAVLAAVIWISLLIPSWRATRNNPNHALRAE
jgi:folate-dependent phosphoribosylglycinamide formyltransferase PurN